MWDFNMDKRFAYFTLPPLLASLPTPEAQLSVHSSLVVHC